MLLLFGSCHFLLLAATCSWAAFLALTISTSSCQRNTEPCSMTVVLLARLSLSNSINKFNKRRVRTEQRVALPCTSSCSPSCSARGRRRRSSPSVRGCSPGRFSGLAPEASVPPRSRERRWRRCRRLKSKRGLLFGSTRNLKKKKTKRRDTRRRISPRARRCLQWAPLTCAPS